MVTDPLPASALVLLGLTAMAANGTPMREVLGGYRRAVGVAGDRGDADRQDDAQQRPRPPHRADVRARLRQASLGISYALMTTDVSLASGVPSITARSAGMMLPVAVSIAELFRFAPRVASSRSAAS